MPDDTTPPPPIRLKWHKLRWRATDPAFSRTNLAAALAVGAPCEVDLRFTADHHALCLHDATLDAETSGTGPVATATRRDLEQYRQRGNLGEVLGAGLLFLDEVVALAAASDVPPGAAQIQLDVKTPVDDLHPRAVAGLAGLLADAAPAFIVSGYEPALLRRLVDAVPGVRHGFDPLHLYRHRRELTPDDLRALARHTRAAVPDAAVYYLEARLILGALDRGVDLVAELAPGPTGNAMVDAWTVDPGRSGLDGALRRLVAAGVGQITTNDPCSLATEPALLRPAR